MRRYGASVLARSAGAFASKAPRFLCHVFVTHAEPMGYGVQLVFSDQHARGIFPWRYFDELALVDVSTRLLM